MGDFNVVEIRRQFPALSLTENDKPIVYLDSAATALKPKSVIDRLQQFYSFEASNVHRGSYGLSQRATDEFEKSREAAARFVGARDSSEIVFTKGTTEGLNLVAWTKGSQLKPGDRVLITEIEHHSNFVPWYMICKTYGLKLEVVPSVDLGLVPPEEIIRSIERTQPKIVSITHGSNLTGQMMPISEIAKVTHGVGGHLVVDGAQWIANHSTNVSDLDADFYVFSTHKLFGPFGHGVLFGKKELLSQMPPWQGGGAMIQEVSQEVITYLDPPFRFEAGTPNIAGALGLKSAIEFVEQLDFAAVVAHEKKLTQSLRLQLKEISPNVKILGPGPEEDRLPLVSFWIPGLHSQDVGQILDMDGICVRVGQHCSQPVHRKLGMEQGSIRASFSIYNTEDDVQRLLEGVQKAKGMLL